MVQRRKFSREFKLESVNLMLGRSVSIAQVARDLVVNQTQSVKTDTRLPGSKILLSGQ